MVNAYTILIFGEDDNDRRALGHLVRALCPDNAKVRIEPRRQPIVLSRECAASGKRRSMANDIAQFARAEDGPGRRVVVIVHRDCDRLEPAHQEEAEALRMELRSAGIADVVAATPAWEIEAWWMLFPQALAATRRCWRIVDYAHQHVGLIPHAKERLRRDLRPVAWPARKSCKDFVESDGVRVAEEVLRAGLLREAARSRSDSFQCFKAGIEAIFTT